MRNEKEAIQKVQSLIQRAFEVLEKRPGFEARPVQRQMAEFVTNCLQQGAHGLIEAPTGVGKSLGALIPALARALIYDERVIVTTYTNVLAEQYWQKDLPLALELFGKAGQEIRTELIMGKPRYACLELATGPEVQGLPDSVRRFIHQWLGSTERGTENEFAAFMRRKRVPLVITREVWSKLAVPPLCRQRLCPHYQRCFYFRTRRSATGAQVVITNHSVILADAEMRWLTGGSVSILDDYDLLILDEAHDFLDSVRSAMEFTLDSAATDNVVRMAARLVNQMGEVVEGASVPSSFVEGLQELVSHFAKNVQALMMELELQLSNVQQSVLVAASPPDILPQESVQPYTRRDLLPLIQHTAERLQSELVRFFKAVRKTLEQYKPLMSDAGYEAAKELFNQQAWWFKKFAGGLKQLLYPVVGVTWIECGKGNYRGVCTIPLEFADLLKERLWDVCPTIAMSATLAIDGSFEFFQKQIGLAGAMTCRLPTVFDYKTRAALYLPPKGRLPEPPASAKSRHAEQYYRLVAQELEKILTATRGRALVLFSSRAEMEAVRSHMSDRSDIPILMQGSSGHADLSQQFKEHTHSVLFGLRSFWTGFDAPGETLSCVVLVRIPFEVPVEPEQVARHALIESRGGNPFLEWSLPNAKQAIKQGAGRLLRTVEDRGIICLLDARLYTKRYGQEILANLPEGMPTFDEIDEAVKWSGI